MKALFIFFSISFLLQSCTKQEDCPQHFQLSARIIPMEKSYHLGDTITISSKFHREILGINVEEKEVGKFDMEGIRWQPATVIFKIDSMNNWVSSINDNFVFIHNPSYDYDLVGVATDFETIEGEYNYQKDSFLLEVKLVTQKIGTYFLKQGSTIEIAGGDRQDFPGRCNGDGFDGRVKMNDGSNNNIDLLEESPDSLFNTVVLAKPNSRFHWGGGYCFKVVE